MAGLDLDLVRHALEVARKEGFVEVELEDETSAFHARLAPKKKSKAAPTGAPVVDIDPTFPVKSAFVGYFRPGPNPVSAGAVVAKGDSLGTVVALGLANSVEANKPGTVEEVLVADGEPVEFGQPLFILHEEGK